MSDWKQEIEIALTHLRDAEGHDDEPTTTALNAVPKHHKAYILHLFGTACHEFLRHKRVLFGDHDPASTLGTLCKRSDRTTPSLSTPFGSDEQEDFCPAPWNIDRSTWSQLVHVDRLFEQANHRQSQRYGLDQHVLDIQLEMPVFSDEDSLSTFRQNNSPKHTDAASSIRQCLRYWPGMEVPPLDECPTRELFSVNNMDNEPQVDASTYRTLLRLEDMMDRSGSGSRRCKEVVDQKLKVAITIEASAENSSTDLSKLSSPNIASPLAKERPAGDSWMMNSLFGSGTNAVPHAAVAVNDRIPSSVSDYDAYPEVYTLSSRVTPLSSTPSLKETLSFISSPEQTPVVHDMDSDIFVEKSSSDVTSPTNSHISLVVLDKSPTPPTRNATTCLPLTIGSDRSSSRSKEGQHALASYLGPDAGRTSTSTHIIETPVLQKRPRHFSHANTEVPRASVTPPARRTQMRDNVFSSSHQVHDFMAIRSTKRSCI
ncbi:hypothetical protein BCR43DRAFT_519328 [Syncephalastrum racemosum]|uniref:Uncharacterized protein n=1 Tax=Syncephalastrum racemosum TaxID=13706 RepID=A0A1X2GZ60_SYNRA|nr:hypothetical protein BCR43DRAFT_519328 [Syncephalastrum racemosum]